MGARGDFPLSERERRIPRLGKEEEGFECCETRSEEILEDFLAAGARKQFCRALAEPLLPRQPSARPRNLLPATLLEREGEG